MKWVKPFTQLPEAEDYNELCFSLEEMIEAFKAGKASIESYGHIGVWTYFFTKYSIDLTKYTKE